MAKPYSMDLRERVVAATGRGLSCRQAAKRFGVAASTAIGWVKRVRTTGSAAPGKMGGWRRGKIAGQHRDWLVERCKARAKQFGYQASALAENRNYFGTTFWFPPGEPGGGITGLAAVVF
jgi:putative transposase